MNSALFLPRTGKLNKPQPANKSLGLILNFYFFQQKKKPHFKSPTFYSPRCFSPPHSFPVSENQPVSKPRLACGPVTPLIAIPALH